MQIIFSIWFRISCTVEIHRSLFSFVINMHCFSLSVLPLSIKSSHFLFIIYYAVSSIMISESFQTSEFLRSFEDAIHFTSLCFFCRSSLVQVRLNFCRQWKKNRSNWRAHFSCTLDMKRKQTAGSMEQRWTLQATHLLSLSMNSVGTWIIFNSP